MPYRKQILTAVFAVLLLFYGGDWLLRNVVWDPLAGIHAETATLQKRIDQRETFLEQARRARVRLDVWRSHSLPSDVEVARSLYQAWLLELVDHVGLAKPSVDSDRPVSRPGGLRMHAFTVRGRGTLEQLTSLLVEFYRAAHLDQIRSLVIAPVAGSDEFQLTLSIEALSLPGAKHENTLCADTSDRLVYQDPSAYELIVRRNLFRTGGAVDATETTQLTGVTYEDGVAVAWFTVHTTGETVKRRTAENLQVGHFSGVVTEIVDSDLILESDGQRWLLTIGDKLSEACALPPER